MRAITLQTGRKPSDPHAVQRYVMVCGLAKSHLAGVLVPSIECDNQNMSVVSNSACNIGVFVAFCLYMTLLTHSFSLTFA
jgi:hypothetical protein